MQKIPKITREITITIGIFFDGTGNNAVNVSSMLTSCAFKRGDLSGVDAESLLKKHSKGHFGLTGSEATSYNGYYTNIYHLWRLYRQTFVPDTLEVQQRIYIEGIGTEAGKPDSKKGLVLGVGGTGVIEKTNIAIKGLAEGIRSALSEVHRQLPDDEPVIKYLQFDIFGFSRGAAAARHLANRIKSEEISIIHALWDGMNGPEFEKMPAVRVRFIGLFDTVTTTGIVSVTPGRSRPDTGDIKLALDPDVAEHVFQINAAHECRFNFALNSIKPIWPELVLPGAHSDIGGGYLPMVEENVFLTRPEVETVPFSLPGNQTRGYNRALKQMDGLYLSASIGPVLRNSKVAVETWYDDRMLPDRYGQLQKRSYTAITLRHRIVSHDWSKVALRIMLDAAKDAGVLFEDIEEDSDLNLPGELSSLCQKARLQGKSVRAGQLPVLFSQNELNVLAKKYIHCSANWNYILTNNDNMIQGGTSPLSIISFVNRPDKNWQRTVYFFSRST